MSKHTPSRFSSSEPIYLVGEQYRKPPARRDTDTVYIAVITDPRDTYCAMIRAFRTEAGARRWAKETIATIQQERAVPLRTEILEQLGGLYD